MFPIIIPKPIGISNNGSQSFLIARYMYEYFLTLCRERLGKVECGRFGADMKVSLINDGPFTIVLDNEAVIKNK